MFLGRDPSPIRALSQLAGYVEGGHIYCHREMFLPYIPAGSDPGSDPCLRRQLISCKLILPKSLDFYGERI